MNEILLFISHATADAPLANSLVVAIEKALKIPTRQLRCTSIDGYGLPGGADTDESLRDEIQRARTFVALLTPTSLSSTYVLFELGARWGAGKHLIPMLARGAKPSVMKGPLTGLHALSATSRPQVLQLIEELSDKLDAKLEPLASFQAAVDAVVAAAAENALADPPTISTESFQRPARQLPQNLSDAEMIALIQDWMGHRSPRENTEVIYFADVDRDIGLPEGTAKRLVEIAARKYNLAPERRGDNLILFDDVPQHVQIEGFDF